MNYYLIVLRPNGPQMFGPFNTLEQRNDYAAGLWFGEPVRMPWEQRGTRQSWYNKETMHLYYFSVSNNRVSDARNVTVAQLAAGKAGRKFLKKEKA